MIVMLGPKTHNACGGPQRSGMAKKAKRTIFQIIGYKDGSRIRLPFPNAGRVYSWNWDNLKKLFG